jgi:hypothetical protein
MADARLIEYRLKCGRIQSETALVEVLGYQGLLPARKVGNCVVVTGIGIGYPRGRKVWNAAVAFSVSDPERFTILPPVAVRANAAGEPNIVGFLSQAPIAERARRGRYAS